MPKLRVIDNPKYKLKKLLRLGPNECRYPYGDPSDETLAFCGKPRGKDQSYCGFHHDICYKAPKSGK